MDIRLGAGFFWTHETFDEFASLLEDAEQLGYDTLWLANEKFYHDMYVMATVAAATVTATALGASAASAAPNAGEKGPDKGTRAPLIGTAKPTAIDGRYIVVLNDRATTADRAAPAEATPSAGTRTRGEKADARTPRAG